MRAFEFLLEASLRPSELKKYDTRPGQFADLINQGFVFKNKDGQDVVFDKVDKDTLINSITTLPVQQSFTLPGKVAGEQVSDINTSTIIKPAAMRGAKGQPETERKSYNIGDIGEALMGLCVTGRLFNEGKDVNEAQILAFWPFIEWQKTGSGANITASGRIQRSVEYAEEDISPDTVELIIKMNDRSFAPLDEMMNKKELAKDVKGALSSTLAYVNERDEIKNLVSEIKSRKGNNKVEVISDGISDNIGTVADLVINVDGERIRLLSLKTGGTQTLGQASGTTYERRDEEGNLIGGLSYFFETAFGFSISEYKNDLEQTKQITDKKERNQAGFEILKRIYDEKIYPQLESELEDGTIRKQSTTLKTMARAANIFARGKKLEDVVLVKLSDNPNSAGYKAMKITDNLYEALAKLDLEVSMSGSDTGRKIEIRVKKEPGLKMKADESLLFRIRSFYQTQGYVRNYFEYGDELIKLASF
jgi:hypothetical protein